MSMYVKKGFMRLDQVSPFATSVDQIVKVCNPCHLNFTLALLFNSTLSLLLN